MKEYMEENKNAWNDAFLKSNLYDDNILSTLNKTNYIYIKKELLDFINQEILENKKIAQFGSNRGLELIYLCNHYKCNGVGFDFSDKMVDYSNYLSHKFKSNTVFIQSNLEEISEEYKESFDFGLITVGVLMWFDDLNVLFKNISKTLKKGAKLFIQEIHPYTNMLKIKQRKEKVSYFQIKPWTETTGILYMTNKRYKSNKITIFPHTLSSIINLLISNNLKVISFFEYEVDISGNYKKYTASGIPLSFILVLEKQ